MLGFLSKLLTLWTHLDILVGASSLDGILITGRHYTEEVWFGRAASLNRIITEYKTQQKHTEINYNTCKLLQQIIQ